MVKGLVQLMALAGIVACLSACAPRFGKLPDGPRLERIKRSPNYDREVGQFKNLEPTTMLTSAKKGNRFFTILKFLFGTMERPKPPAELPMAKIDFRGLDRNVDLVVWLGHSSCYLQLGGQRILIDPVFSDSAAPFARFNRDFNGPYPYSIDDVPDVDILLITHDHWDHLDYPTLRALRQRVKAVVCPLGVGSHLEYWGFDPAIIHEGDWHDTFRLATDVTVHVLPARHFSGRWLSRNKTLWASFMIETAGRRVFCSGDSGYGSHFAEIGERFGGVDLALMENGQYNMRWRHSHLLPEETVRAAVDVKARAVLPIHTGRFSLSDHPWDDPYVKLTAACGDNAFGLLTSTIGQVVYLDGREQHFTPWWESVGSGE
ncbi:MAG: MBL fold metallo-hydrolase [Phycisphaerae bacterium]|nr:MBL fold metallo-hydrolase [Phycisphaerae bacterium]